MDILGINAKLMKIMKNYENNAELMEIGLRVRHEFFRTIKLKPLRPMVRGNNLKAKRSGRSFTYLRILIVD